MYSNQFSRENCGRETVLLFRRDGSDFPHRNNVEQRYEVSDRALHQAACSGNEHLISVLLQYGQDVNARERLNGKTALHYARSREIARLLLANGAFVDARDDKNQFTPLHEALRCKREGVVEILLESGADPNSVTGGHHERTPLLIAIENNFAKAVKHLLKFGANMKTDEKVSRTPLHIAAEITDCPETVQCLLQYYDIDLQDQHGFSALHLAAIKRRMHNVRLLLSRGANVSMKTKLGDIISNMLTPHPQSNLFYLTDPGLIHVAQAFKLHILKFKLAGLCQTSNHYRALDHCMRQFDKLYGDVLRADTCLSNRYKREIHETKLDCEIELRELKDFKLTTTMSLHNLLLTEIPHYVQNEPLMCSYKSINYNSYPHYAGILDRKIRRDTMRSNLLFKSRDSFAKLMEMSSNKTQLPTLPIDVEMRILCYLDDIDLERLIQSTNETD